MGIKAYILTNKTIFCKGFALKILKISMAYVTPQYLKKRNG